MLNKKREGTTHELKIAPEFFKAVCSGAKSFEIRRNDRDFKVDDMLLLQEYKPNSGEYTGRTVCRRVTYLTDYAQKENYVVMGLAIPMMTARELAERSQLKTVN